MATEPVGCWGLASVFAAGLAVVAVWVALPTVASAGVLYPDPVDGWTYVFDGDADAEGENKQNALDGTWRHDQADQWDGSGPAEAGTAPGGVKAFTSDSDETTFLRVQDTGNPKDHGFSAPSNRKIYFAHDLTNEDANIDTAVLDNGITISFRARLATGDPLDDQYAEGAAGPAPWPAGGSGYPIHGDGRGMFGVMQKANAPPGSFTTGQISFALATEQDTSGIGSGLIMNNLIDNEVIFDVDTSSATAETLNVVPLSDAELTDWHEFWITLQKGPIVGDQNGTQSHQIDVYMDGAAEPTTFLVSMAIPAEYDESSNASAYLTMGASSGSALGAFDLDFFAYTLGVIAPGGGMLLGDVNLDGVVNGLDVDPFVAVLLNGPFQAEADMNEDGVVNGLDVDPFVAAVVGGGGLMASVVPEPSGLGLVLLAAGVLLAGRGRRRGR